MNNFDKKRFGRYAKWDLTINKNFYRNLGLVIFFTILGITILSFFTRWAMYSMKMPKELYSDMWLASMVLISIIMYALWVASGCILHPLRNKQGRITNLTLPVTSLEKYLWHVLICVIGCTVLSVISVAISDGINALMTLAAMGPDAVSSLFVSTYNPDIIPHMNFNEMDSSDISAKPEILLSKDLGQAFILMIYVSLYFNAAIFAIGNSIKYKFNIPLTYVALQAIEFIFGILFFIIMICIINSHPHIEQSTIQNFFKNLSTFIYILEGIGIAIGTGLWYWSYKLYCKAELTNRLNK